MCCGNSLDMPWQGASNEYPHHLFLWRNKKNIMWIPSYLELCFCIFLAKVGVSYSMASIVQFKELFTIKNTDSLFISRQKHMLWVRLMFLWINKKVITWMPL